MPVSNRSFEPPVATRSFIETKDYRRCYERASAASILVISGRSGSGKTWIARQIVANLCSKYEEEQPGYCGMFATLKCTNVEMLHEGVSDVLLDFDIELEQRRANQQSWQVLLQFFRLLNEKYPKHKKYFILDDVVGEESFFDIIDEIGKKMKKLEPEIRSTWKIVVATTEINVKKRKYKDIGESNIVTLEGFSLEDTTNLYTNEADDVVLEQNEIVKSLYEELGGLPLALSVAIKDLGIANELEKPSQFVENYLARLQSKMETMHTQGRGDRSSPLAACELSIERCIDDNSNRDFYIKFFRMLSCFNENDIPAELLKACAETLNPTEPIMAADSVGHLMGRMKRRGLCTKVTDSCENIFFSMHALIKTAMKTVFYKRDEDLKPLYKNALVALTRVMPKDGRQHNPHLPAYYFRHGQSMNEAIGDLMLMPDGPMQSLIMFLRCDLSISIGYCLITHRNEQRGHKHFEAALKMYSLLVTGKTYQQLQSETSADRELAQVLYQEGQKIDLLQTPEYLQFIEELPQFHVLTQTSLGNMVSISESDLINRHLSRRKFGELQHERRVLGPKERLAKVYMGEMLAHIYFAWSKVYLHLDLSAGQANTYIQYAVRALDVYEKILEDHKVYLLQGLIAERTLLRCELEKATTVAAADSILLRWQGLSGIGNCGQYPERDAAYECGLVKSYLSADNFHKLLCKEGRLCALGMKYKFTGERNESERERNEAERERVFTEGKELFGEILTLIKDMAEEPHKYNPQAMSKSHQHFAKFLSCCGEYKLAVKSIICSLNELRRLRGGLDPAHISFSKPYSDLEKYYSLYQQTRPDGDRLLAGQDSEANMVRDIIGVVNKPPPLNQPDCVDNIQILVQIAMEEIEDSIPVGATSGGGNA